MSHGWQVARQQGLLDSRLIRGISFSIQYIYLNISVSIHIFIPIYLIYLDISNVMSCNVTRMASSQTAGSPTFSAHQSLVLLNLDSRLAAIFDRFRQVAPVRVLPAVHQHHRGVKPVEYSLHEENKSGKLGPA